VLARLPQMLREQLHDVVLRVAEFASREQLAGVGMRGRWQLTGHYEGVTLTERSQLNYERLPPAIILIRQPLLAEWAETVVGFWEPMSKNRRYARVHSRNRRFEVDSTPGSVYYAHILY
jgi:predicted Zn-dependent protease with MMP-like domain